MSCRRFASTPPSIRRYCTDGSMLLSTVFCTMSSISFIWQKMSARCGLMGVYSGSDDSWPSVPMPQSTSRSRSAVSLGACAGSSRLVFCLAKNFCVSSYDRWPGFMTRAGELHSLRMYCSAWKMCCFASLSSLPACSEASCPRAW